MSIIILNYKDLEIEYDLDDEYVDVVKIGIYFKKYIHNWIQSNNFVDICYFVNTQLTGNHIEDWENLGYSDKRIILRDNGYYGHIKKEGVNILISKSIFLEFTDWCGDIDFKYWIRKKIGEINKSLKRDKQLDKIDGGEIINENNLSYRIVLWENICRKNSKLNIEDTLINVINNRSKTRRIDFIEKDKKNIIIYELKFKKINLNMVTEVIADKQYIDLCEQLFNKSVKLIFMGYAGIDEYALNLINRLTNVEYISVQEFVKHLYTMGTRHKWKDNKRHLKFRLMDKTFINLFDQDFVKTVFNDN